MTYSEGLLLHEGGEAILGSYLVDDLIVRRVDDKDVSKKLSGRAEMLGRGRELLGLQCESSYQTEPTCMTIKFWSICVVTVPKSGANSYWPGATSLCLWEEEARREIKGQSVQ